MRFKKWISPLICSLIGLGVGGSCLAMDIEIQFNNDKAPASRYDATLYYSTAGQIPGPWSFFGADRPYDTEKITPTEKSQHKLTFRGIKSEKSIYQLKSMEFAEIKDGYLTSFSISFSADPAQDQTYLTQEGANYNEKTQTLTLKLNRWENETIIIPLSLKKLQLTLDFKRSSGMQDGY